MKKHTFCFDNVVNCQCRYVTNIQAIGAKKGFTRGLIWLSKSKILNNKFCMREI